MCKVSIIITVYNTAKYLRKCIDSVLNQSLECFQIICIDDASEDNSLELLKQYSDSRIEVYHNEKNMGAGYSKNLGLSKAKGEYICMLDSDDMLTDDALETLYSIGKSLNADVVRFCMGNMYEDSEQYIRDASCREENKISVFEKGKDFLIYILDNNVFYTGARNFFRKSVLQDRRVRFTENSYNDDLEFTIFLYNRSKKIVYFQKELYIYLHRSKNSISSEVSKCEFWKQYFQIGKRIINELGNENGEILNDKLQDYFWETCLNENMKMSEADRKDFIESLSTSEQEVFEEKQKETCLKGIYWNLTVQDIEELKKLNNIYIYGTGKYATELYRILKSNNILVQGFIETEKKRYKYLEEVVLSIKEVNSENSIIMIGVSNLYYEEIKRILINGQYNVFELNK